MFQSRHDIHSIGLSLPNVLGVETWLCLHVRKESHESRI
jgi:hypothetical protein